MVFKVNMTDCCLPNHHRFGVEIHPSAVAHLVVYERPAVVVVVLGRNTVHRLWHSLSRCIVAVGDSVGAVWQSGQASAHTPRKTAPVEVLCRVAYSVVGDALAVVCGEQILPLAVAVCVCTDRGVVELFGEVNSRREISPPTVSSLMGNFVSVGLENYWKPTNMGTALLCTGKHRLLGTKGRLLG